ncbi:MAG: DUF58 domain-containing protein [Dehalococcoidia bacterium]|nr:DUF58 domain-containing protein [Dehalococcoidia bacterium]
MLGGAWLFVTFVLLVGAIALQQVLLLLVALLFFTASGVARLWAHYALERVVYGRGLSANRAFFGDTIVLDTRLANSKILPLPWIHVRDEVPQDLTFLRHKTSPAHRQGRAILSNLFSLGWYHRITRRYSVQCLKRGYFTFGPANIRSGDLFGFFDKATTEEKLDYLLVYPRIVPLEDLGIPSKAPLGDIHVRRHLFDDPVRVVTTREYAPGDPLKNIHWKATARLGRLQSRTFEPTTTVDIALFLDVRTVEAPIWGRVEQLLETAVIATASIVNHAVRNGYRAGLYVNEPYLFKQGLIKLPSSDHPDQLQRVLEALAQVQGWPALPLEQLLNREARNVHGAATLAVVTAELSESLLASLHRFRRAGRRVVLVLVGEQWRGVSLGSIPVYHVSDRVDWRDLESVQLDQVRQEEQR